MECRISSRFGIQVASDVSVLYGSERKVIDMVYPNIFPARWPWVYVLRGHLPLRILIPASTRVGEQVDYRSTQHRTCYIILLDLIGVHRTGTNTGTYLPR